MTLLLSLFFLTPIQNRTQIIQSVIPYPVDPLGRRVSEIARVEVAAEEQNESDIFPIAVLELRELLGFFPAQPVGGCRASRCFELNHERFVSLAGAKRLHLTIDRGFDGGLLGEAARNSKRARRHCIKFTGFVGFYLLISVSEKPSLESSKLLLFQLTEEGVVSAEQAPLAKGAGGEAEEQIVVEIDRLSDICFP